MRLFPKALLLASAVGALAAAPTLRAAQYENKPNPAPKAGGSQGSHDTHGAEHGDPSMNKPAVGASLDARLVDEEAKARQQAATVQVTVKGVRLIDPAMVKEKPRTGQAHLHYQVDTGPVVATTTTKLSFHGLPRGQHTILVQLGPTTTAPWGRKSG